MKIISLFSGAGGMDLGFAQAGFDVIWSNEYDKTIWKTHEVNFPHCTLSRDSITDIAAPDVPDCDGIIGGPPCQSFSLAGAKRGTQDKRGQLFWDYIRILKEKKPAFFVAENVTGLLSPRHAKDLQGFIQAFEDAGYHVHYHTYDASDYGTPQARKRVVFVGLHHRLGKTFTTPPEVTPRATLMDAIGGMPEPLACKAGAHHAHCTDSHEYMTGGFSSMYMSRNRVKQWSEPSFTILATARQIPIHPQASVMLKVAKDQWRFQDDHPPRRLSVRECARIQGFPDDFSFHYDKIENGYKMIGNAVPVPLARSIAQHIMALLR